jgi:nucleotide-binding universal stress UspA family protein
MYERILVPVDGSPTSDRGLEEAIGMAQCSGGRLRLVHVIDELSFAICMEAYAGYSGDWLSVLRENGAAILQQAMSRVADADVEADTMLHDGLSGPLHVVVAGEARRWQADLIVLGTHGRRGAHGKAPGIGSQEILRQASVPVRLVHPGDSPAAEAAYESARMRVRAVVAADAATS